MESAIISFFNKSNPPVHWINLFYPFPPAKAGRASNKSLLSPGGDYGIKEGSEQGIRKESGNINKQKLLLRATLITIVLATIFCFWGNRPPRPAFSSPVAGNSGPQSREETTALERLQRTLQEQAAAGRAEISLSLFDFGSGEWIGFNADRPVYPASLIKSLILLTALEQVHRGNLSLEDTYLLTAADKYAGDTPVTGSGTLQFAPEGNIYTVEELLALMVGLSDNIASNIVLDLVGPAAVDAMAVRLGLDNTRATRKMYDLGSSLPANVSTARDLAVILVALEKGNICGERLSRIGIAMMLHTDNKQRIARYIKPRQAKVANKIGTVSGLIGDMALLYFPHRPPVALSILVKNPPDEREAEKEIGRIAATVVQILGPE